MYLIVWNGTVFDTKTTYAKMNCLIENYFDIKQCVNKIYTYTKLN